MTISIELYADVRKQHENGKSQRQIASDLHISRYMVQRYCKGENTPWTRKTPQRKSPVITQEVIDFIKHCLEEDEQEGIKKQKHTAKRIYDRLVQEVGFTGGESTVRKAVQKIKEKVSKAFVPLRFEPGEAMQVDWGEGTVYMAGERKTVNLLCARMCYSCKPIVLAYRYQNEESFHHAFVTIFELLGGVPRDVIFDNARVAVKKGFGPCAVKQAGYAALCAHYAFNAVFCNAASGNEKGLVESLVGWARRNILTPIPKVNDFEELNELLAKGCREYGNHIITSRGNVTVDELFEHEKKALNKLPQCPFETAKCLDVRVSTYSTVRFQTNDYSVPTTYVGQNVGVKAYPEKVEIYSNGVLIAVHARIHGEHQMSCRLADYVPLLEEKNRAVLNAIPVKQNLSKEAFEELKANIHNKEKVSEILRREAGLPPQVPKKGGSKQIEQIAIKESPNIKQVNLGEYDQLIGKDK